MTLLFHSLARRPSVSPVFCVLVLMCHAGFVRGQDISRRPLTHQDYDVWNTISRSSISNDGKWAMYLVQNGAIDGEATLHFHHIETAKEYVIERGTDPQITNDSRFAIYRITPEKAKLKKMRKDKAKDDELPKPRLQILELASGDVTTLENVRSFQIPEENSDWVACLLEKPAGAASINDKKSGNREVYEVTREGLRRPEERFKLKSRAQLARERGEVEEEEVNPEKEASKSESESEKESKKGKKSQGQTGKDDKEKDEDEKTKKAGTPLVLINLDNAIQRTFPSVASYGFSKNGKILAFATSVESKPDDDAKGGSEKDGQPDSPKQPVGERGPVDGFHVVKLDSLQQLTLASGTGEYKSMELSDDGERVAFISNRDDYNAESPAWTLFLWHGRAKEAKPIAKEGEKGIPAGWWISPKSSQRFSEDGRRLFFDTAPIPEQVLKERQAAEEGRDVEEEDDDEKAKLDLWHWKDPQLQPQQLLRAAAERDRDYRAEYLLKSGDILQLASRQVPDVRLDYRSKSDLAIANTNMRYRRTLSWDVPGFQDAYLVNLKTGERELVLERVKWNVSMSPEGKFITWFDAEKKKWFAKPTSEPESKPVEISKGIKYALQDELHDTPNLPRAYGTAGWLIDDRALLVYDRFDIWQLDPTGDVAPICLTNGVGRKQKIRFRYLVLDWEQRAIDPEKPMVLGAFDRSTKASGFYSLELPESGDEATDSRELNPLIMLDEELGGLRKAKDSDAVLFTRSTFRRCPDLWSSTLGFEKIYRVSDINPQQDEYSWGTAELVHWNAKDGQELDGILLKPDGFDPTREYPMIVYFYERNSDNLHRYYTPAAGRSIICHSFYVSRGYLVFIPDIPYKTGEPGPSAANSILPGVEHLIAQGFVDKDRIGTQGHSWGGYQTAYLVTQTDMFACAESGAPVSNMTSAYGGIRWGSGLSRMFQYERTQSRIGDDLWAARDKYIANSPLFFADQINTPLLILHNDEDGAVPWYQGIELFVALRRLGKPAWMLNYNGDPHWVMGDYNRRDFATRMQQFFDHYLKDAPEPEWMAVGIPAVDKGEKYGLELLEPVQEESEPTPATAAE